MPSLAARLQRRRRGEARGSGQRFRADTSAFAGVQQNGVNGAVEATRKASGPAPLALEELEEGDWSEDDRHGQPAYSTLLTQLRSSVQKSSQGDSTSSRKRQKVDLGPVERRVRKLLESSDGASPTVSLEPGATQIPDHQQQTAPHTAQRSEVSAPAQHLNRCCRLAIVTKDISLSVLAFKLPVRPVSVKLIKVEWSQADTPFTHIACLSGCLQHALLKMLPLLKKEVETRRISTRVCVQPGPMQTGHSLENY